MAQPTLSPRTRAAAGPVLAVAGGVLTDGFAAWAYYGEVFRPLAHTFGLWIALLAAAAAGWLLVSAPDLLEQFLITGSL